MKIYDVTIGEIVNECKLHTSWEECEKCKYHNFCSDIDTYTRVYFGFFSQFKNMDIKPRTRQEKLKEDYGIKLNQRQSYLVMINCLGILWRHACNKMYDGGYDYKKTLEFILDESKKYTDLYNSEIDKEEGINEH